jgi:DNA polymerase
MSKEQQLVSVAKRIEQELVCPLKDAATNLVFGKGNPEAQIMFIGEAPGRNEDEQGLPFVGAAGKKLDELLHVIGLSIDDVYIANILKYRPPKNRDPNGQEIVTHTPYLVEQIKIIKPRVLITLGNFATKFVLAGFNPDGMKKIGGISTLHGTHVPISVDGFSCTVVPLYHPAAMMYRPQLRQVIEEDFKNMHGLLENKIGIKKQ